MCSPDVFPSRVLLEQRVGSVRLHNQRRKEMGWGGAVVGSRAAVQGPCGSLSVKQTPSEAAVLRAFDSTQVWSRRPLKQATL